MSMFRYRAYNATGQIIQGAIEADSVIIAENRLRASGIWLLDAREGSAVETGETHDIAVKRGDLINFFVQMTLLLRAGIPIPNAIDRLANDTEGTRLGTVLGTVRDQLTLGVQLHQSLAMFPRSFPPQVVAIVHAGEVSGHLPESFEGLSSYYEWLDRLIGEIRQALIYPLMVTGAAFALVLLLFTFIVPRFVSLLTDLSLGVPLVTRITIWISNLLLHGWPFIIGGGVAAWFGLKMLLRVPRYARVFDRALMKLPIFGPLIAMFALSRFTQNLAMLYRSGITLLRGLEICKKLVGNQALEQAIEEVRTAVTEGTHFSKSLAKHDIFPPTVVTMISTGETSGTLDVALQSVADYYNKIIPRRIKVVFAIFDPVIMLSLIAVVGFVAMAVVLPILQLWNAR
ncbi:MAG: type II secretion system F family protein [Verrucomicrobia bacterium]|nr:type II secretion system F family protein [Verrucomicrobiota bacterium]